MSMERVFLIADDSDQKMAMLRGILQAAGWKGTVLTADTTEEAITQIERAERIDAAFIDYYIPAGNGPAIIRHLRMKFPGAKIALVSSADNAKNAAEAKEAGADAVICSTLEDSMERLKSIIMDWKLGWIA
jgi:CheY-like chemotaxis protein